MGGGTFDVSVVNVRKNKQTLKKQFQVLGVGGDTRLGGEDFTNMLADKLLEDSGLTEAIKVSPNDDDETRKKKRFARKKVYKDSERVKNDLSVNYDSGVYIDIIDGNNIETSVSRDQFEELIQPEVEKSINFVKETLSRIGMHNENKIDGK